MRAERGKGEHEAIAPGGRVQALLFEKVAVRVHSRIAEQTSTPPDFGWSGRSVQLSTCFLHTTCPLGRLADPLDVSCTLPYKFECTLANLKMTTFA